MLYLIEPCISGDCCRHRQEFLSRGERWIPECDTDGRYKPLQCLPGTSPGGQKECQCLSPYGDILTRFPNNGFGQITSCNCFFENHYYSNRGSPGYENVNYGGMYYGEGRDIGPTRMNTEYMGRNFYELGWMPERQPVCYPDGRYQIRRRCSSDGYCWCIDDYGMIRSERRRDRNLICA